MPPIFHLLKSPVLCVHVYLCMCVCVFVLSLSSCFECVVAGSLGLDQSGRCFGRAPGLLICSLFFFSFAFLSFFFLEKDYTFCYKVQLVFDRNVTMIRISSLAQFVCLHFLKSLTHHLRQQSTVISQKANYGHLLYNITAFQWWLV